MKNKLFLSVIAVTSIGLALNGADNNLISPALQLPLNGSIFADRDELVPSEISLPLDGSTFSVNETLLNEKYADKLGIIAGFTLSVAAPMSILAATKCAAKYVAPNYTGQLKKELEKELKSSSLETTLAIPLFITAGAMCCLVGIETFNTVRTQSLQEIQKAQRHLQSVSDNHNVLVSGNQRKRHLAVIGEEEKKLIAEEAPVQSNTPYTCYTWDLTSLKKATPGHLANTIYLGWANKKMINNVIEKTEALDDQIMPITYVKAAK